MKYIVVGGAGFIGHNVVQQLEQQGHTCYILDSVTNYHYIPSDELEFLHKNRCKKISSKIHQIDITDYPLVKLFFATYADDIDAIIHLASYPNQKIAQIDPINSAKLMCSSLVHLLELAKDFNIPKFVYISSSMVYGNFDNNVSENHICNPIGIYGILKYTGELLVKDYYNDNRYSHLIIRPSAVYGEYDIKDRVVSKFMRSAIRNETLLVHGMNEILDFTYVNDAVNGIVASTLSNKTNNKTYNITRSRGITLLNAAKLIVAIADSGSIVISNKDINFPSRGSLNIDAARKDFGFNPTMDIEKGFIRYHKWLMDSGFYNDTF
jgi:nucleoside-diphosphate-sugar epimerase